MKRMLKNSEFWLGTLFLLVLCVKITEVHAQEITSGASVRPDGFSGGEHYEYTWYTDDDWRFGLTYTTRQVVAGMAVEAYPSGYVQRMFRKRKVYAGLGVAMHPVREPLLSMTGSFRITAGYQFDRQWSLEWTHMSNARIRQPNWGQDLLLVRYRWSQ